MSTQHPTIPPRYNRSLMNPLITSVNQYLAQSRKRDAYFTIIGDGSEYQLIDSSTGIGETYGDGADTVITAFDNLPSSRIGKWKEKVKLIGNFNFEKNVDLVGYLVLDIQEASITLKDNINANMFTGDGVGEIDIINGRGIGNKNNNSQGWAFEFKNLAYTVRMFGGYLEDFKSGAVLFDKGSIVGWFDNIDTWGCDPAFKVSGYLDSTHPTRGVWITRNLNDYSGGKNVWLAGDPSTPLRSIFVMNNWWYEAHSNSVRATYCLDSYICDNHQYGYAGQSSIYLDNFSRGHVDRNILPNCGYYNDPNIYDGITSYACDGTTFLGNTIINAIDPTYGVEELKMRYGIYLHGSGVNKCTNCVVDNNIIKGFLTKGILGGDPTCKIGVNNVGGPIWRNSGNSQGTGVQQSILHGLSDTPNRVRPISVEDGANARMTAISDATYIYITAESGKDYTWEAEYVR